MINHHLLLFTDPATEEASQLPKVKYTSVQYTNIASTYYLSAPPCELQLHLKVQSARSVQGNLQRSNITKTKIDHYPFESYGQ